MTVLLHGKKNSKETDAYIRDFIKQLEEKKINIIYVDSFYQYLKKILIQNNNIDVKTIHNLDEINIKIDYLICFGGDGTILDAATIVKDSGIPIVGINTGRLGFLASIAKHELSTLLEDLLDKKYRLSNRALLNISTKETHLDIPFALNEMSVSSKENTAMINIKVFLNNKYLNTYWADGLIISTPTGSTGYSLSCGGPIVMPESNNFIITPIAPHNLNVRPLVVSDDNIIKIEILDNSTRKFLLSMDSRNQYIINSSSIVVQKAKYSISLLELKAKNYSKTLREKLLWGLDKRNDEA